MREASEAEAPTKEVEAFCDEVTVERAFTIDYRLNLSDQGLGQGFIGVQEQDPGRVDSQHVEGPLPFLGISPRISKLFDFSSKLLRD